MDRWYPKFLPRFKFISQVIHTGLRHFSSKVTAMYLFDSSYSSQEIPTYVTLQLAQIYGKGKDRLDIVTPHVKSQVGGNDCGAFAIANMVEFCLGNFSKNDDDSLNIRGYYDQDNLRSIWLSASRQVYLPNWT